MASKISRHQVATYLADQLANGETSRRVAQTLAAYLTEARQQRQVDLYLRDIRAELATRHGHMSAEVVSARQLTAELRQYLTNVVKNTTNIEEVELMETIDTDLIGGVIVRTPDSEMDNSVKNNLAKLRAI
jgi:F-type H+-transporting ATPase subunit delta